MDIPQRVTEIANTLKERGFTPVGYAEVEQGYVVQVAEQG